MGISQVSELLPEGLHSIVLEHINNTLSLLPELQHKAIIGKYSEIHRTTSEREANLFILHLRDYSEVIKTLNTYFIPSFLSMFNALLTSDKSGKKLAVRMKLHGNVKGLQYANLDSERLQLQASTEANRCARMFSRGHDLEDVINYAKNNGVSHIAGNDKAQEKRLSSPYWWLGQIKRLKTQGNEAHAQLLNLVKKHISKHGYNNQQSKHEANIEAMNKSYAISPTGEQVSLLNIAMSAIKGRFSRLLCWTDGMGEYANKYGHSCAMFTITCPSRMHPNSKKYDGTTTRESQQYLADLWNQANARFKKAGIYPYGVRVAEPHKDGAVHWHVLLFAPLDVLSKIDDILADHALREDGSEKGADKHRYEFKLIDDRKGGAKPSSYLFKYLMKGIGGNSETGTADDVDSIITARLSSVKAWSRTHGIRQVQIIGGASVGVWDELRRLDKVLEDSHLETMRLACKDNDYCLYFELQGGHTISRTSHYAKPIRKAIQTTRETINRDTGEIESTVEPSLNAYGELLTEVIGIETDRQTFINPRPKWEIELFRDKENESLTIATNEGFSLLEAMPRPSLGNLS